MTNAINITQRQAYLADSFMVTARPWHWEQFWNHMAAIRRLAMEQRNGSRPKASCFTGPNGSGKTSAAKLLGMQASCEQVDGLLQSGRPAIHCGQCQGCRQVHGRVGMYKGGYIELDGGSKSIVADIEEAISRGWSRKAWGSDRLPYLLAIDEAGFMPEQAYRLLHKQIEESRKMQFILIVRSVEHEQLTAPLKDRLQAATYRFKLPTVDDAARGLRCVAQIAGLGLTDEAARWIAQKNGGTPRACLGDLDRLRHLQGTVDLPVARSIIVDDEDEETENADEETPEPTDDV